MNKHTILIGIDPGETHSGIVIIDKMGEITAMIPDNSEVLKIIKRTAAEYRPVSMAYEDIRNPYPGMRAETITTCKFIGVLEYVIGRMKWVEATGYDRNRVRKWVFDTFPEVVVPRIAAKIAYLDNQGAKLNRRRYLSKDGKSLRSPSFHFVDDRIVIAAMKERFNIPTPKPGKTNLYGLRAHSWQALAVAAYHQSKLIG